MIEKIFELVKKGEGEQVEFKTNFTKEIGKDICAFANTAGGYVLIGVTDDGKIVGTDSSEQRIWDVVNGIHPYPKISIIEEYVGTKRIIVINVKKSNKMHEIRNVVYVRSGMNNRPLNIQEMLDKASESLIIGFGGQKTGIKVKDANAVLLDYVIEECAKNNRLKPENMNKSKIGEALGLIKGKYLTSAGVLFLTDNPEIEYPQAVVDVLYYRSGEESYDERITIGGPVFKQINKIESIFKQEIKNIPTFQGWKRMDIEIYPISALREAVINAIAHRNYYSTSSTQIAIYRNKIIIRNPGGFPPGVTLDNPIHKPRNPIISDILYKIGYIEKVGRGIKLIRDKCGQNPFVSVSFNAKPYFTEVVFSKTTAAELDEVDAKIIKYMREHGEMTAAALERVIGMARKNIVQRLNKLIELGIVSKKGASRSVKYFLYLQGNEKG